MSNNPTSLLPATPAAWLPFEQSLLSDLQSSDNQCTLNVFSAGVPTIPKAVAHFLSSFTSLTPRAGTKAGESFPDLIFLVNFNDMEFACIEHWLTLYAEHYYAKEDGKTKKNVVSIKKISSAESAHTLSKRAELFLKGGVFAITYKQLVLDLLTKRLSPSVISGFIINNAHKIKPNNSESFLC